ncbi:MAG: aminotransferase class V-fold PLP-dependent enzyme, partial [Myxococcota bacterium]
MQSHLSPSPAADQAPTRGQPEPLDIDQIRGDFPALDQTVHGHPLAYLDSAATALKPQSVIDAITQVYSRDCGNIQRGVHALSQRATHSYEAARAAVSRFVGAAAADEIVFTAGATAAVNLVAQSWAGTHLRAGDRIVVTELEHHSNLVPWQRAAAAVGAEVVAAPVATSGPDTGRVSLDDLDRLITERTRLVAVSHVSNVLGTVLPIAEIAELARARGARLLVDGAQAAPHLPLDVAALGCDFYVISGHKLYGPSGVGALWARRDLLAAMEPYQLGGGMIQTVTVAASTYRDSPHRFEAGTPPIAGAIGLGAAIAYLDGLDSAAVASHERALCDYAADQLAQVPGLVIHGPARASRADRRDHIAVLSFTIDG